MKANTQNETAWIARGASVDAREAIHARDCADLAEEAGDPDMEAPAWRLQQAEAEDRVIAAAEAVEEFRGRMVAKQDSEDDALLSELDAVSAMSAYFPLMVFL